MYNVVLTVHHREYVEIKCQLDVTEVFIAVLQHVSGTTMPIIRSSRVLYSGVQDAAASCKPDT